jgi:pimeloyl-ACP methyl ester carboxylesterase
MGLIRLILRLLGALFRPLFSAALDDLDDGFSGLSAGDNTISTGAFRDTARARTIPFKLYAPDDPEDAPDPGPRPVVIFSHGLGGSRDAAPFLGEALSRNGYYAFFIQHPGSDASILDGVKSRDEVMQRLRAVMQNPGNAPDRFRDLHVVIDQMHLMNAPDGPLAGKLDLGRIGMAGHSYGARSVLTAAGQKMGMYGSPFKDPRVRAGIALSPNLPTQMMPGQDPSFPYTGIDIPVFHMTGTEDGMPLGEGSPGAGPGGEFDPATRTLPYRYTPATDQYLLILDGAHHNTFSSRLRNVDDINPDEVVSPTMGGMEEVRHVQAVAMGAVLFFDAYLKRDAAALKMLREGYAQTLNPGDHFEYK